MTRPSGPPLSLLVALAWALACSGGAGGADAGAEVRYCQSPAECGRDETCLRGVCGRECLWDEDCGDVNRFVCRFYECRPAAVGFPDTQGPETTGADGGGEGGGARPCERDLDCKDLDLVCLDGRCDKQCDEPLDCGDPTLTCYAHRCFPVAAEPQPEVLDATPDAGPLKAYGAPCDKGSECEGGWCVQHMLLGTKTCTQLCAGAGDSYSCPGTDICFGPLADEQGQPRFICVANDAGSANCQACTTGLSLTNPQGQCRCTVPCPDAGKCPTNMGCAPVNVGGTPTDVCIPVGQPCDPNQPNTSPCYGVCLPRDGSGAWFCTVPCEGSADCPTGTSCHAEVVDGVVLSWCIP